MGMDVPVGMLSWKCGFWKITAIWPFGASLDCSALGMSLSRSALGASLGHSALGCQEVE